MLPLGIPGHIFPALIHHIIFEIVSYRAFVSFLENPQDMKMWKDFFLSEKM